MNYYVLITKFSKLLTKCIKKHEKRNKKRLTKLGKSLGRPNKFSIRFYVMHIIDVLINGTAWNKLNLRNEKCKRQITGDAIRKKFYKWNDAGIFKRTHNKFMHIYKNEIGEDFLKNMYIDSSVVPNMNNSNLASYSYKYKNKKSIKINAICDDKKIIHSIFFSKSSIYDSKLIIDPVNELKTTPTHLMGDLGYISNKQTLKKLQLKNITLVTDKRKNMKKKNI